MTEEEYFRKYHPDSCYGDKPLSPHWDFFQDGVEFGERQSEKKIADLEKENAELKEALKNDKVCKCSHYFNFKDLEKENAELKAQLENDRDLPAIAYMQGAEKQKKKDAEQLTKAKEIIRDFIAVAIDYIDKEDKNYSFIIEAEQFLKEIEK